MDKLAQKIVPAEKLTNNLMLLVVGARYYQYHAKTIVYWGALLLSPNPPQLFEQKNVSNTMIYDFGQNKGEIGPSGARPGRPFDSYYNHALKHNKEGAPGTAECLP